MSSINEDRQTLMYKGCLRLKIEGNGSKVTFQTNKELSLLYCPIQKVGSTFWRPILKNKVTVDAYIQTTAQYDAKNILGEKHEKPLKFVFVRNPYERALSGYVDKLFGTNTQFWKQSGQHIVRTFRHYPSNHSLLCGHDVTFLEYFQYIIHAENTLIKRNVHFSPMFHHCNLCSEKYDFIGKLETFKDDASYILNVLAERGRNNYKDDLIIDEQTEGNRLENKIHLIYNMKRDIEMCIPFYEALTRTWRNFQIRGLIGKNVSMPITKEESHRIQRDEVKTIVVEAWKKSGGRDYRMNNKLEAFREAYETIPVNLLENFISAFRPDFELLGYDPRPSTIFDKTGTNNKTFNYFKL